MNINDLTMEREMVEIPFKEADKSAFSIFSPHDIAKKLVIRNFIHNSCGTVDREKLQSIGGFLPIRPSDYVLWLRMSEFYYFVLVPYFLTTKYFNSTSMERRRKRILFEE